MRYRCVSVHHVEAVVPLGVQELVADPHQVLGVLGIQLHARANASVNEQKVAAANIVPQAAQKKLVSLRQGGAKGILYLFYSLPPRRDDAVGRQRREAT